MALSVVIPVYNEAENIDSLLQEIIQALSDIDEYEIVVVDDGSSDDTQKVLKETSQKSNSSIRIIQHSDNYGQSAAIHTGVVCSTYDWIATLDGDGQNDPADIPLLYSNMPGGNPKLKMVCGHRQKRRDSVSKRFSSRIANAIRSGLLSDGVPDTGCGLKIISKEVFLSLPYFDHMHRFLPALVKRAGWDIVSCKVSHRPRLKGTSKYGIGNRLFVGIVDMFGVLWLQRRSKNPEYKEL